MEIKRLINYCDMQIKRYKDNIETLRLSANPTYDWDKHNIFTDKIQKYKDIKQALEKQVPKKVTGEYEDEPLCPCCLEVIDGYNVEIIKHCPECGQKIDWEAIETGRKA